MTRIARRLIGPALLAVVFGAVVACERSADVPTPTSAADASTTRGFATPEAAIERFNMLATRRPALDLPAVLDLFHAENDAQRRLIRIVRDARPLLELDQALWEIFGTGMSPTQPGPPLAPLIEPAQLSASIGHRAAARFVRADHTSAKLFLVNVDGRWWLSAHTLEQSPGMFGTAPDPDAQETINRFLAPDAPAVTRRLRAGDFASAAEAGFALGRAAAQRAPEIGERPELLLERIGAAQSAAGAEATDPFGD